MPAMPPRYRHLAAVCLTLAASAAGARADVVADAPAIRPATDAALVPPAPPAPPTRAERAEALVPRLAAPDPAERASAVAAIERIGRRARPALVAATRSGDPAVAPAARAVLMRLSWHRLSDPPAVRDVLRDYGSRPASLRAAVPGVLNALPDRSGRPAMLRLLADDPSDAVGWAVIDLVRLDPDGESTAALRADADRALAAGPDDPSPGTDADADVVEEVDDGDTSGLAPRSAPALFAAAVAVGPLTADGFPDPADPRVADLLARAVDAATPTPDFRQLGRVFDGVARRREAAGDVAGALDLRRRELVLAGASGGTDVQYEFAVVGRTDPRRDAAREIVALHARHGPLPGWAGDLAALWLGGAGDADGPTTAATAVSISGDGSTRGPSGVARPVALYAAADRLRTLGRPDLGAAVAGAAWLAGGTDRDGRSQAAADLRRLGWTAAERAELRAVVALSPAPKPLPAPVDPQRNRGRVKPRVVAAPERAGAGPARVAVVPGVRAFDLVARPDRAADATEAEALVRLAQLDADAGDFAAAADRIARAVALPVGFHRAEDAAGTVRRLGREPLVARAAAYRLRASRDAGDARASKRRLAALASIVAAHPTLAEDAIRALDGVPAPRAPGSTDAEARPHSPESGAVYDAAVAAARGQPNGMAGPNAEGGADGPAAQNNLAWLNARTGRDLDAALKLARAATRASPSAGNLDTLAEVHYMRGEFDRAVEVERRALRLDPPEGFLREQLAKFRAAQIEAGPTPPSTRPADDLDDLDAPPDDAGLDLGAPRDRDALPRIVPVPGGLDLPLPIPLPIPGLIR